MEGVWRGIVRFVGNFGVRNNNLRKMKKSVVGSMVVGCLLVELMGGCAKDLEEGLPKVTTNSLISLTESTFEVGGTVVSEGSGSVIKRGISWSGTGDPRSASATKSDNGTGIGVYRSKITGLTPETRYYYRAYATNSAGTSYGEEASVVTKKAILAPTVTTMPISSVELTTAECGGIVSANGGDSIVLCGICWDTNPNPTSSSTNKIVLTYSTPVYSCSLTNLSFSTKYYVRAFAINSKGVSYGEEVSFTTKVFPDFQMAIILGGTYQMGSYNGNSDEKPEHWVTLSNFKIGIREVTVELWNAVMPNSSFRNELNKLPISNVSLNDAMTFVRRLGLATNKNYRLPTEAEWEYVAGEGSSNRTLYATGLNDTTSFAERAWYLTNADDVLHEVGALLPNKLGVYDLGGNVMEWCYDWYGDYSSSDATNPKGPTFGSKKVLRGGSFADPAANCRTSTRMSMDPAGSNRRTGIRIALTE